MPKPLDDTQLHDIFARTRAAAIATAREDVNVFASLVLSDERTGKRIKQAPIHRKMHALMDAYPRVVLWGHVESGKSYQLTARILHALGRDPTLRVGLVGRTFKQAEKTLRPIRVAIEQNQTLREIFPHLRPGSPWREAAIAVARQVSARDPSIQALGVGGAVLGSRLDYVVMDDVVDLSTSSTAHGRDQLQSWVLNTLFGRLTADARVVVVGNAYHPEDLMHFLEKLEGWSGYRFPVLDAYGNPTWPERWPMERIEAKKAEVGPLEFARSMMCLPRSEDDARFKRADVDACLLRGKNLGANLPTSTASWRPEWTEEQKRKCRFYTGVDLAIQLHTQADISAIFTIAVHPDGVREVVGLESGRWPAREILQRIGDTYRRWGSVVAIENVAAQEWLRQFAVELQGVPAMPYTTGRGRASLEFQAESLAAEIANHRWIIPCDQNLRPHPEVQEWVTALLYYNPKAHTPDRMAASLFARWYAFRGDPAQTVGTGVRDLSEGGGDAWGGSGGGGLWG